MLPNARLYAHRKSEQAVQLYDERASVGCIVTTEKDLGVFISSNLKVAEHCYDANCKANKMLGLVQRTIKHRSPDLMVRLYKSLVRPHLEYCSPVWNPHYGKDKLLLERVQHRFTRLFDDLKNLPYSDRLNKLKLWSLEPGGEKESHGSDRTVQDGTRLVIGSIADLLSAG